jgi:Mrp family chromosome partitioning ATPase
VAQEPGATNGTKNGDSPHHEAAPTDAPADEGGKVILVSSPGPSEGKTTLTANLSAVFAEAGYRVLALNCDYRRPKLHEQFGVEYEPRRVVATEVPGVSIIADVIDDAHHINPAEAVASQREVIEKAREMFDLILLDTAPLLTTNDAADLLAIVDMVVVAARGNRTTNEAGYRAAELLERRGARVIGAVLVDGEAKKAGQYYYYRDGYYEDEYTNEARRPRDEASVIDTELGLAGDPAVIAEGGSGDER